ncbi:hypothetical protein, partial [Roseiconus lacunae]
PDGHMEMLMTFRLSLLLFAVTATFVARAEEIEVTPKWIDDNPGVFSIVYGSGFGHHDTFTVTFQPSKKDVYEIRTELRLDPGKEKSNDWPYTAPFVLHRFRSDSGTRRIEFQTTYQHSHAPDVRTKLRVLQALPYQYKGEDKLTWGFEPLYIIDLEKFWHLAR